MMTMIIIMMMVVMMMTMIMRILSFLLRSPAISLGFTAFG